MSDVLVYVLLAVMVLVLLDALVLAGLMIARRIRGRRPARSAVPTVLGTLLYAVPSRQDSSTALAALTAAGYPTIVDPLDERMLLISCPRGSEHRDEVRALLAREARRPSRTPGLGWSGPVRFSDEI